MKTILTVEDDKEISRLIGDYLSLQGYEARSRIDLIRMGADDYIVSNIRQKLKKLDPDNAYIETVRGMGYRLT